VCDRTRVLLVLQILPPNTTSTQNLAERLIIHTSFTAPLRGMMMSLAAKLCLQRACCFFASFVNALAFRRLRIGFGLDGCFFCPVVLF
jgi:hypothetical protein